MVVFQVNSLLSFRNFPVEAENLEDAVETHEAQVFAPGNAAVKRDDAEQVDDAVRGKDIADPTGRRVDAKDIFHHEQPHEHRVYEEERGAEAFRAREKFQGQNSHRQDDENHQREMKRMSRPPVPVVHHRPQVLPEDMPFMVAAVDHGVIVIVCV